MGQVKRDALKALLLPSTVVTANLAGTDYVCDLHRFHELVVTWDITAAVHTNETYDLYITTGDGTSAWDLVHFPRVATTGAKRFTARILADLLPEQLLGSTEVNQTILQVDAGGGQGIETIGAQSVVHGPFGDRIGFQLVVAGTAPSITCSIRITAAG